MKKLSTACNDFAIYKTLVKGLQEGERACDQESSQGNDIMVEEV
jgi:hypothetical protein